jgi:hypothetical protein
MSQQVHFVCSRGGGRIYSEGMRVEKLVAGTRDNESLGSLQNRFREKVLKLEPIRLAFGPRMLSRLKIPHTYYW